ncbi:MAG: MFS transporter [Nitrospira sp. SB0672_bin_25]|nr:MFS transporter [Nitrospira sp. SB0666_bin_27]MYF24413.1 MFS transporter [Nitrospira sp. SB0678_bin_10]MYJ54075.1 MFS transporter [Nitrospira sp. SB0672_bin_25]
MTFDPKSETAADQAGASDFVSLPRRQLLVALSGVLLALLLAALSQTIVATAMPRIIIDLGGFDRYTWATTSYIVASAVAVPIVGRLSDLYGSRIFFLLGITIFMIGSIPTGLSQTMSQLIGFRAIQGLGGGIIITTSLVAIADLFPPQDRGKFQGLVALVYGMASVLGPTLGGFITDNLSWNWIFLFNVPAGIPVLLLIARTFPQNTPNTPEVTQRNLDYPGMMTLICAIISILLPLSWAGVQYEWSSPQTIGLLAFGLVMTVAFVVVESRSDSPIMPLDVYRNRVMAVSVVVMCLSGLALYGSIMFVPLFFQGVLGASATSSGRFLTPMLLAVAFGAVLSGVLLHRTGRYRRQALFSTGLMTTGMMLLSAMDERTSFAGAVGSIVVMGLGLGGTLPVFTVAVQNSIPNKFRGFATSMLLFYRLVGGMMGLAVLGAVLTKQFSKRLEGMLSENVRALLSQDRLDAIEKNPRVLFDPSTTDTLKAEFAEAGADAARMTDMLLDALHSALAGAVGDTLTVGAVAVALSVVAVLFLGTPGGSAHAPERG